MGDDRAVLTLAVGKPLYARLATALARSFHLWNRSPAIRFVIATDQPESLPPDVIASSEVLRIRAGEYGEGFSPKLHLDAMAPAAQTLFIDADSLCVADLTPAFERFAGRAVGVVGGTIAEGEWFGDVGRVRRTLGLPPLPKFNGGIYYLESGPRAREVYRLARALEPRYDELGLVRLRGRPNDELLMAIAMATCGATGLADDGSIMAEPLNFACGLQIDVLAGRATLRNTPGHPRYNAAWPLEVAHPRVVHFLGEHTDRVPYTAEERKLALVATRQWSPWRANGFVELTHTLPARLTTLAKDVLRPTYHALFGARPVTQSSRV